MRWVDLHTHSNKSDGSFSPSRLISYAACKDLAAIALTDHDTIDGLDEAISQASLLREKNDSSIEVIPGIEFSTEYEGKDIHIVGLYIAYKDPVFAKPLENFVNARIVRNIEMCDRLRADGIDITFEKLQAAYPDSVITRAHYASYLMEHGYVTCRQDAFAKYVGDHTKYFVPRKKISPQDAVELILRGSGVPILAHPTLYHMSATRLDTLVGTLKEAGLLGMEVKYSTYSASEERDMMLLCKKYDLLCSGGSDFHGENKPGLDLGSGYGKLFIPEDFLDSIKVARKVRT